MRDSEQRQITDTAYYAAIDLLEEHRGHLDGLATALLDKETLDSNEVDELLKDLEPASDSSSQIGVELPRERIAATDPATEGLLRADRSDPPKPA